MTFDPEILLVAISSDYFDSLLYGINQSLLDKLQALLACRLPDCS